MVNLRYFSHHIFWMCVRQITPQNVDVPETFVNQPNTPSHIDLANIDHETYHKEGFETLC